MAARIGVHAADLRKAFPEIMGAKFGFILAECYAPTPIEAVLLNTTGVGLTNMIMQNDQDTLPREQRLRVLPPLPRSSMVDHYKDAIQRQLKLCNGPCGRKHIRARTTHYNCPSLSLRRCPPKRSELRQEPKRGLSTLVGREAVGQGEGGFSPAAMTILHPVGSLGSDRTHA